MLDKQKAIEIAEEHTAQVPLDHPGYQMACELLGNTGNEWLFSYRVECLIDIPVEEQEQFAGAAGFVIDSAGLVQELSVPMFIELEQKVIKEN